MFSSPCSLRSTQCAALIALATAAGISRFEPAPEKTAAPPAENATRSVFTVATISRAHFYLAAMQALAPQFRASRATFDFASDPATTGHLSDAVATTSDSSWPPLPPPPGSRLNFPVPTRHAPSVRQHAHPYAVGPPRRGIEQPLRAAGTEVPGDSSARRSQVLRIAPLSPFALRAPLTRTFDSGPKLAESNFLPDSALRGEPAFRLRSVLPFARAARRAPVARRRLSS